MRISEVILYVQDLGIELEFYRDTLGLDVLYADADWAELDTGNCRLCLHAGGHRRYGEDAPKIVFDVEAIEAARDALLDMGVDLGELRSPAPGVIACDGVDPEGNKFSFERRS